MMDNDIGTYGIYLGLSAQHWLIFDWGYPREISQVEWYCTSDSKTRITSCDIYVSNDTVNWGSAVATDVAFSIVDSWNGIAFTAKVGRFIKIADIDTTQASHYLLGYEIKAYCDVSPP